jgi:mannosyltransferase
MLTEHVDEPSRESTLGRPEVSTTRTAQLMQGVRWLASRTWLWPALVAGVLGRWRLRRPELWRDELRSWSAASRPVGDLVHLLHNTDVAVALYYFALHYWISVFGDSILAMRMMSVVAMAAAAGFVAVIGQRLYDRTVGLVGGLLFAVIPAVTRFAQEVRPYAVTLLIVCVATLLFLRALEQPKWHRWVGYAISVTAVALIQVVALPVLVAHGVGVLIWKRQRGPLVAWSLSLAAGLTLAAPVIVLGESQYNHQVGALPAATWQDLARIPAHLFSSALAAGAMILLALFALARNRAVSGFLVAWAVLPIGIVWLASNLGHSYWMARYLLPTLPAFALLAAAGATRLVNTRAAALLAVVLLALSYPDQQAVRQVASHDDWTYPDANPQFFNYSYLASILRSHLQPGDGIVYADRADYWLADLGVAYHLRGQPQPRDVFVATSARDRGDFWPIECAPADTCVVDAPRVWVVAEEWSDETDPFAAMEPDKEDVLKAGYYVDHQYPTLPDPTRYGARTFGLVLTLLIQK